MLERGNGPTNIMWWTQSLFWSWGVNKDVLILCVYYCIATQIFILRLFLEMGCDLGTTLFVLWNVTIKTIELLFSFGKATLLQKCLLNSDLDTVGQRVILSCTVKMESS